MEKVYVYECHEYDLDMIISIIKPAIDKIREEKKIFKKGESVFLKINMLTDRKPDQFTTTHPVFTQAVIHILKEYGLKLIIGDSSSGLFNKAILKRNYEATGYLELANKEGIELNYDTSSITINDLPQVKAMHETDYVVNLCKLKSHVMTTFTGAVKNCFGSVPGTSKALQHALHPSKKSFAKHIIEVCDTLNPVISLMDGIEGMQGNGPSNGVLFKAGLIAISDNPYALDKTITDLLLIPGAIIPIDQEARNQQKYSEIELISSSTREQLIRKGFKLPDTVSKENIPYPHYDIDKCVGCGRCMEACPAKTVIVKNGKAVFNKDNCIKCYCCQEVCPKDAIDFNTNS